MLKEKYKNDYSKLIKDRLELGLSNNLHLVWLDLETTGFNTTLHTCDKTSATLLGCQYHDIMEIAVIITDLTLQPKAEICIPISHVDIDFSKMDDWCTKTHTESGLIERCQQSSIRLNDAEKRVLDLLHSCGIQRKEGYLSGNSIHFDFMFIASQMHDLMDYLHYRLVDVSGYKTPLTAIYPEIKKKLNVIKTGQHQALIDINESIEEFKFYLDHLVK